MHWPRCLRLAFEQYTYVLCSSNYFSATFHFASSFFACDRSCSPVPQVRLFVTGYNTTRLELCYSSL